MGRRTKIVATIGPASDEPDVLRRLIEAGVDVARLGFAHGTLDSQLERMARIRKAATDVGRHVGILADLPGPKVRTGEFVDGGVFLAEGDRVALVPSDDPSTADRIAVDYETLLEDVEPGDRIALGDGAVSLVVDGVGDWAVHAVVDHGGRVQGRPGVHLPAERLRGEVPTAEDLRLLGAVCEAGVDFVAVSFVRSRDDIDRARAAAGDDPPMFVAKIETRAAVERLDEIIDTADAVMVARGDLGVECRLAEVPHLQKRIVRQCVAYGRPVITATQVLESMVHAPSPTRAEVTDIANAVFDGTDALMLSAETAIGHDPVLVVRTMAEIAERAEQESDYVAWGGRLGKLQRRAEMPPSLMLTGAITHAAWQAAHESGACAVLCCSRTGTTVRAMARFRPEAPLVGFTPSARTARQLALTWGAEGVVIDEYTSSVEMAEAAVTIASEMGIVESGEIVAVVNGNPRTGGIDALRLLRVE